MLGDRFQDLLAAFSEQKLIVLAFDPDVQVHMLTGRIRLANRRRRFLGFLAGHL